jgi:Uma2 family endonuclease
MRALIDLPEIEYLDGEAYPKASPRTTHAMVQGRIWSILSTAAATRGYVGTEWDVHPGKADGTTTTFVPDAAFISRERLASLDRADREEPPFAPDIAVEIWSPSNDRAYLDRKIAKYLATGAVLVLDVNPFDRTIAAWGDAGVRRFANGDTFEHAAVPWLRFAVKDAFDDLDERDPLV